MSECASRKSDQLKQKTTEN